jgi:hypothetical protein
MEKAERKRAERVSFKRSSIFIFVIDEKTTISGSFGLGGSYVF